MSKSLATKIFEIRNTIGKLSKDKKNPFFNSQYFDINSLLEHTQSYFEACKILLTQPIKDGVVCTVLEDLESGETMESGIPLPNIDDPQKIGSAITYYRRYTLKSLLAIQEEDDDANRASGNNRNGTQTKNYGNDDKPWLGEEMKEEWQKAEDAIRKGLAEPRDLRKKYKVSKANMAHFERIKAESAQNGDKQAKQIYG